MEPYICINGDFLKREEIKFEYFNRSFKYGDGFFETIKVCSKKVPFWKFHKKRMKKAIKAFHLTHSFNFKQIKSNLLSLLELNNLSNARVRVTFYRDGSGLYSPESNNTRFVIEASELNETHYKYSENGISLGIYKEIKIQPSVISKFKTNNSLPYVLASIYAKSNNYHNVLLLNSKNKIADTIHSNIWMVKDGIIITPPVSDGAIAGTLRSYLAKKLPNWNFVLRKESITLNSLEKADEVFLTNAIKGIQWVKSVNKSKYPNKVSKKLNTLLNNDILCS